MLSISWISFSRYLWGKMRLWAYVSYIIVNILWFRYSIFCYQFWFLFSFRQEKRISIRLSAIVTQAQESFLPIMFQLHALWIVKSNEFGSMILISVKMVNWQLRQIGHWIPRYIQTILLSTDVYNINYVVQWQFCIITFERQV